MVPELKERFMAAAEEDGWLMERDLERDLERARVMLLAGQSPENVSEWMRLPLERVESLL